MPLATEVLRPDDKIVVFGETSKIDSAAEG
jgi:hypothetical protein